MPSEAAAAVQTRRVANSQSAFRGPARDGSSGQHALQPRVSLATRKATGDPSNFRNDRPQEEADQAAILLDSFHTVLYPYLTQRCFLNDRTGKHVRSILNKECFIRENIKLVLTWLPAEDWLEVRKVHQLIFRLLHEAAAEERGKWQWRGFWMSPYENTTIAFEILRGFLCGGAWQD